MEDLKMEKKLKIALLAPVDAHGHVNAMIGLADQLRLRGHQLVFICNDSQTPAHFGHETISARNWSAAQVSAEPSLEADRETKSCGAQSEEFIFTGNEKLEAKWAEMVDLLDLEVSKSFALEGAGSECWSMEATSVANSLTHNFQLLKLTVEREIVELDRQFERIILHIKADLVIVDQLCPIPAVHRLAARGLRWLSVCSANPMGVHWARAQLSADARWFPAPLLGVPVDRSWPGAEASRRAYERALVDSGMRALVGRLGELAGLPAPSDEPAVMRRWAEFALNQSPWLNVYAYPARLDYAREHPELGLGPLWVRVDALVRQPARLSDEGALAQERLLQQVSAWRELRPADGAKPIIIYVSLGSTASANVRLMDKLLLQIFQCCERRSAWHFALALGSRAHLLPEATRARLAHWTRRARLLGQRWWPQPELVRRNLLDACVSHGGNNTLCELFQLARAPLGRVLVCAFHDQLDNARRVHQLGLGVALGAAQLLAGPPDLWLERAIERSLQVAASERSPLAADPSRPAELSAARLIEQKFAHASAR